MFIICALQVLINSQYVNNRHANKPLIVRTRGRPICVFQGRYDTDYYRSSRPITDILNRYTCLV